MENKPVVKVCALTYRMGPSLQLIELVRFRISLYVEFRSLPTLVYCEEIAQVDESSLYLFLTVDPNTPSAVELAVRKFAQEKGFKFQRRAMNDWSRSDIGFRLKFS